MEFPKAIIIGSGARKRYVEDIFTIREVQGWTVINQNELSSVREYAGARIPIAVAIRDPKATQEICVWLLEAGYYLMRVIHPSVVISPGARIGEGTILNAGSVIQPNAEVGRCCMIHANALIEHDCHIGDFSTIGPGVNLAGWVKVNRRATIHTGASVVPKVIIGSDSIVAAGATVIRNVMPGTTVAGVPAAPMEEKAEE